MKHLATLLLLCGISIFATAQNYPVGHRSINFKDAARTGGYAISNAAVFPTGGTGRDIGTEVYYPATSTGDNTPFATGTFPLIVFGHGFVMTWDSYKSLTDSLVRNGYIVALPRTEGSVQNSHLDFGKDLAKIVVLLQQANTTTGSSFVGKLTNRAAIGGHSMGGGATFLADASAPSEVVCYFTFAAAETNPSAVAAAASITRPHLTISGSYDCVAPPASHQNLIYNALASTCKTKIELTKGYHCAFADNSFTCGFGEGTCITSGGLTVANQQLLTRRYLNPYLDYYLKGICPAWTKFEDLIDSTTTATVQQSCNNIVPSNAAILGDTAFCQGTSTTLTANPSGFNYLWSDNTTGNVTTVSTAGTHTLTIGNGTCTLPSVSINTTLKPLPSGIQVASNTDTICSGDTIQVSASAINADYYQWTIPQGWQLLSGDSIAAITLVADSNAATVSVSASNECGNSTVAVTDTIRLWPALDSVAPFIGDWWECIGNTHTTTVPSVANALYYEWNYNGTSYITNEPTFTTDALTLPMNTISVTAVGRCSQVFIGTDHVGGLNLTLNVTQSGDTLIATGGFQGYYVWYKDTTQVGSGEYFLPTEQGLYTVKSYCEAEATISYQTIGIIALNSKANNIYPNPIKRGDILHLPSNKQLKVYSNLGAVVYEAQQVPQINTAAFAAGIYVLVIDGNVAKLVVE